MPISDNLFNIYFADRPLAGFDAKRDKPVQFKRPDWTKDNYKSKNKTMPNKQKLSEICPV